MGIIKAVVGAIGGGLADSWLEVYESDSMNDATVFTTGVKVRQGDKRSSNTKGTEDTVSNGSIIHVYDNQCMLLVDGGKVVDYTAEPGYYKVDQSSMPSLFNGELGASVKETFSRVKYGGVPSGKQKVFFLRDAAELQSTLAAVQASRYEGKFLIQEMIPGDDTSMRILTTYSDRNGKVRFASFGQTLLEDMRPMGVGNPLAIVSRTDEAIVAEAARLLEAVGYTGFANFDIKVDPRDGSHRFFEINTRLGRSNYYVTAAGDNVARWLMDDLVLGRPLPEGLTVARSESLYTVAPKATLLSYIRDDALRREVRGLYALGRDADPLDYPAEKSLRRRLYPLVFAFRQWKTCRAAMTDKRAREKAAEDLEGAGATTDHRTKGTASGKDDEHVASASPELPLADGLAACAKAAS